MLVILTDEQIIAPQKVCCNCLLADQKGLPRWRQGKLGCGHALRASLNITESWTEQATVTNTNPKTADQPPDMYECQMGFRLANINS